jgi:hypothetical protein
VNETTQAATDLVAHVRRAQRPGRQGSITRLVFRLLKDDEQFFEPVRLRMKLHRAGYAIGATLSNVNTIEELVVVCLEDSYLLVQALELVGEKS